MFTSILTQFESLSGMDLRCETTMNYGEGTASINGQSYTNDSVFSGDLPRVPSDQIPFKMQYCSDNNWVVRTDSLGTYHVYTILGEYIGEEPIARALNSLGVFEPKLAVQETHEGSTPAIHRVCTVGYSNVVNKWLVWGFGSMQTADDFTQACQYSGLNSIVSLKTTMELKYYLSNVLDYSDYLGLNGKSRVDGNTKSPMPVVDYDNPNVPESVEYNYDSIGPEDGASPMMESEGDTVVEPPFKGSPGYLSGEHRQHNLNRAVRRTQSMMPQSGDHRQHNLPKINSNPGAYRPRVEGQASESAADENIHAYEWYRYSPASGRAKHFKDHHKTYELSIAPKELFGVRSTRTGFVLIMSDELSIKFKMTEKEVASLIKVSKPFKGKIGGISLNIKVDAAPTSKKTPKKTVQRDGDSEKIVLSGVVYVGTIQASQFSDDITVLVAKTEKEVVALVKARVATLTNAVPAAGIVQLTTDNSLVVKALDKPNSRFKKAVVDNAIKRSNATVRNLHFTKNMQEYTQKPREPKVGFKRVTPLFGGMGHIALVEVKKAILQNYFSAEFKPAVLTKTKVTFDTDNNTHKSIIAAKNDKPARMTLACQNTSPLFKQEAKNTVGRLEHEYGKRLRSKISVVEIAGTAYTMIIVALAFPKRDAATDTRSRKLYEMQLNTERADSVRHKLGKINSTTSDITRLLNGKKELTGLQEAQLTQKRDALDKLQADVDSITSECLVMHSPVYTIKSGDKFITVEVTGVDVAAGTIEIRSVRGNNRPENTTRLWTFKGKVII